VGERATCLLGPGGLGDAEWIWYRTFLRSTLAAGDALDRRVHGIRDAIRLSDAGSAWFTR
jgi:hypothetical protein